MTTIRLARIPAICVAPSYIADTLLRAERFTDIQYLPTHGNAVARGEIKEQMPDRPGMIQSSPKKIIAKGTDWRFLNEPKRELKGVSHVARGCRLVATLGPSDRMLRQRV